MWRSLSPWQGLSNPSALLVGLCDRAGEAEFLSSLSSSVLQPVEAEGTGGAKVGDH